MNRMKPNGERARAAIIMIWAVIVMEIIAVFSNYMQYDLLQHFSEGVQYTTQQLENNDLRVKLVTVIYGVFFIVSGLTFIMWFRRAYYNLHQCTSYLNHTEGWAAGSWFFPVLNLFRPFQIMRELFEVSAFLLKRSGGGSINGFPTYYLSIWWTLWLINNAMIQILNKISSNGDEVESLSNESLFYILQSVVSITSGLLIIKIVKAYAVREQLLFSMQTNNEQESE